MPSSTEQPAPLILGRYALFGELASGGMATVHYGRLLGPAGFARTVAIKRLHPQFARDPEFAAMFIEEGRLAARLRHPNVVSTLDVIALEDELFLVLEFVLGESLCSLVERLQGRSERVPLPIAVGILDGALEGLHYAHESKGDTGEPLQLVHRDVSPQNILVGEDGVPRVLDFGIAKAAGSLLVTGEGIIKGKIAYMSPEQLLGLGADRRADVYSAALVLWELLVGQRYAKGDTSSDIITRRLSCPVERPSTLNPNIPAALDAVVVRALARDPNERYATAREFALALEQAITPAQPRQIAEWIALVAGETIAARSSQIVAIESDPRVPLLASESMHLRMRSIPRVAAAVDPSIVRTTTDLPAPEETRSTTARGVPSRPTPPRATLTWWAWYAAGAIVIAVALFLLGRATRPMPRAAQTAAVTAPSLATDPHPRPAMSTDRVAPALETEAAPPRAATSASAAPPPASAAPAASEAARARPRGGASAGARTVAASASAAAPAAGTAARTAICNPPFRVDENGIRRLKPECF